MAMAAAAPVNRPLMALRKAGIAPPMAMLWAIANRLPAATLPIPAWIPAAIVPAMGPAMPKPIMPNRTGAAKGAAMTPTEMAAATMAKDVKRTIEK